MDIAVMSRQFVISARAEIVERTGVEMEALTACGVAGLTLLQALLDVDPEARMEELTLWRKSGGRSGNWERRGPEGRMTHS
jgi:cyclic pyranopterin phosphate synthase